MKNLIKDALKKSQKEIVMKVVIREARGQEASEIIEAMSNAENYNTIIIGTSGSGMSIGGRLR